MCLRGVEGYVLRFGMELNGGIGMGRVLGVCFAEEEVGLRWLLAHSFWYYSHFISAAIKHVGQEKLVVAVRSWPQHWLTMVEK